MQCSSLSRRDVLRGMALFTSWAYAPRLASE